MKILLTALMMFPTFTFADLAKVENVTAAKNGGAWTFNVTLSHPDTGWDHYADGWGVYTTMGVELGYRVLHHPHVSEQPFTRSLSSVEIPAGTTQVLIKSRDSVHGESDGILYTLPN